MSNLIVLAASAGVVVFMIAVAAMLGFRERARIDETELARLAGAERASVENAVLDAKGDAGLALLADGKLLIAKVMADGVSTRVAPAPSVRMRLRQGKLRVAFADVGFPVVNLRLAGAAPDWLAKLVTGANA